MKAIMFVGVAAAACLAAGAAAKPPVDGVIGRLLQQPSVRMALDELKRDEPRVVAEQVELTEIPAPPFKESARAEAVRRRFEAAGLEDVRIDAAGNVIGERPGASPRPHVVLAAHLDTVFPEGTPVRVQRDGGTLRAPGIADDGRGLAVLLAVARALGRHHVRTPGRVSFVADVGEEGLSDLRGMKQLFGSTLEAPIDAFVSIDGGGYGITNVAVGSRRYRVTFRGPGGHSFGAFGLVNPAHALGRAIAHIADLQVPASPRVTFNVGRVGGGTSVNAIPSEAWFEVDLRSSDAAALASLDGRFREAIERAVREEDARWGSGHVAMTPDVVGDRPAGRTPDSSAIVRLAADANAALGLPVQLGEGSTDANLPMSLGIPAITVGGGGRAWGAHTLQESFDPTDAWKGSQAALLLVVALAQ